MAESIPGYGDPECYRCPLILNEEMAGLCNAMVFYTRQQEEAAHKENWPAAIFWENKQNQLALKVLKCDPGVGRV